MKLPSSILALSETMGLILAARLKLFSAELQLEKSRLLLLAFCVLFGSGTLLIMLFILFGLGVYLTPADYRIYTVCLGALTFGIMSAGCAVAIWATMGGDRLPFHHTYQEIRKDISCLVTAAQNKQ